MFCEWRRDDNSCTQCMIQLQLNSKMAPDVCWVLGVEESGVSVVLEDVVEEEKELEDDEK